MKSIKLQCKITNPLTANYFHAYFLYIKIYQLTAENK